jgi:hypothetical protein
MKVTRSRLLVCNACLTWQDWCHYHVSVTHVCSLCAGPKPIATHDKRLVPRYLNTPSIGNHDIPYSHCLDMLASILGSAHLDGTVCKLGPRVHSPRIGGDVNALHLVCEAQLSSLLYGLHPVEGPLESQLRQNRLVRCPAQQCPPGHSYVALQIHERRVLCTASHQC